MEKKKHADVPKFISHDYRVQIEFVCLQDIDNFTTDFSSPKSQICLYAFFSKKKQR